MNSLDIALGLSVIVVFVYSRTGECRSSAHFPLEDGMIDDLIDIDAVVENQILERRKTGDLSRTFPAYNDPQNEGSGQSDVDDDADRSSFGSLAGSDDDSEGGSGDYESTTAEVHSSRGNLRRAGTTTTKILASSTATARTTKTAITSTASTLFEPTSSTISYRSTDAYPTTHPIDEEPEIYIDDEDVEGSGSGFSTTSTDATTTSQSTTTSLSIAPKVPPKPNHDLNVNANQSKVDPGSHHGHHSSNDSRNQTEPPHRHHHPHDHQPTHENSALPKNSEKEKPTSKAKEDGGKSLQNGGDLSTSDVAAVSDLLAFWTQPWMLAVLIGGGVVVVLFVVLLVLLAVYKSKMVSEKDLFDFNETLSPKIIAYQMTNQSETWA